ncbi:MAG TPA: hypothetical protein VM537_04370 [Anaerolineae bacterium]|nr:hypothetical protein [Anaerolineae bacterium]
MSKNDVVDTLLDLSGQRNVITVYRAFVDFTGDLAAAMMLSQLLYWTPRSPDPDGWIAKSDVAFAEELCLTTYGVRKGRKILEEMGFLHTEVKRFAGAPTLRYRIDQEFLFRKWTLRKRKMDFAKTQDHVVQRLLQRIQQRRNPVSLRFLNHTKPRNLSSPKSWHKD